MKATNTRKFATYGIADGSPGFPSLTA
jgi:hypothetical protein